MIVCIKVDRIPDDLQVNYVKYHTLAGLRMKMFFDFKDYCGGLEEGQTYMVAEVPDDYSDDIRIDDLVSLGVDIVAYCYEPEPPIVVAVGDGSCRGKFMTEDQIIEEIKPKDIKEVKEPLSPMIATEKDIERAKKMDEALSKALRVYLK